MSNLLLPRVLNLERQCWANMQYSRRECQEVVAIPRSVDDSSFKEKVIQVSEKFGFNIDSNNTEACNRITKKKDSVIVKFSRRKDSQ